MYNDISVMKNLINVNEKVKDLSIESQNQSIKSYLLNGGSLTSIDALNKFGCFRLGARIYDLKQSGMNIDKVTINKDGKRFAQYFLRIES